MLSSSTTPTVPVHDSTHCAVIYTNNNVTGYSDAFITNTNQIAVGADNNLSMTIVNKKGTELPSTGGIGTTIFYIIGAVLVIGGGVVLVTRRRMNNH